MLIFKILFALSLMGGLVSCAGPKPYLDYVLAHQAKISAEASYAPRKSPSNFSQANDYYKRGIDYFKDNQNYKAKEYFTKARQYYEKSENYTRVIDFKSGTGDVFP